MICIAFRTVNMTLQMNIATLKPHENYKDEKVNYDTDDHDNADDYDK